MMTPPRYVQTKSALRRQNRRHHQLQADIMNHARDPGVVIAEFERVVNMSAEEMETWLESEASSCPAYNYYGNERIALENGRMVLDILRRNPDRDISLYTADDVEHMRRVIGYCLRQLALPNSDSNRHRNLKNWGHDMDKT